MSSECGALGEGRLPLYHVLYMTWPITEQHMFRLRVVTLEVETGTSM